MEKWISWEDHPVPEDVRGFFIKYEDGAIWSDRYDHETKKRVFKEKHGKVIGWRWMERSDPNKKTFHA